MDDLLQEFIAETRETLGALSGEIVAWEGDPGDRARLDAIFRFVHTVKGSCGFLDLPRLARLSHAAEDVLAEVRSGERVPDPRMVSAVLAVVDRIGEIVEAIDAGNGLDDSGEDLLIAALAANGDEPVVPAAVSAATAPAARTASRSVRLSTELLDRMMSGMSDMVLARNELARRLRGEIDPGIEAALDRLSLTVAEMRDTVTRTRMQKIDALFSALPRMVRDTAAEVGKQVTLVVEGSDVELDREMIELMRDPLVHIVRNSIDHGIEPPSDRRTVGKREAGRLHVSARQSGNQIIVEIADDGRGIDTERLVAKRLAEGDERDLRNWSEKAKLNLVFEAGLSTKDTVTAISGRGVGMDVVRANIEQIGGRVELINSLGKGLRLAIHVPLTLSIIPAIVIGVAGQRFAVTRQAIEEIVRVGGDAIRVDLLGDTPTATIRDRRLPLIDLAAQLGLRPRDPSRAQMLAIVGMGGGSFAAAVDSVLDHEELVIKPAAPAVMATGLYAGQTLPDSGSPMLLLDCAGIAADAGLSFGRDGEEEDEAEPAAVEEAGATALLFDDLDGRRRAMLLAIVDRVESVPADRIRLAAGRLRLVIDGRIVPLAALGEIAGRDEVTVLRLKDGAAELAYAIAEPLDIVAVPAEVAPALMPGPILGVAMIGGEPVELIDPLWLFGEQAGPLTAPGPRPLCLIDGGTEPWLERFLKPVLEQAGYQVATRPAPGLEPSVILTTGEVAAAPAADPRVLVLSNERGDAGGAQVGRIYRYDRAGLLAAVADRVAR